MCGFFVSLLPKCKLVGRKRCEKKEKQLCLWSLQKNSVVQTFVSRKQLGIFTRVEKQLKLLALPWDRQRRVRNADSVFCVSFLASVYEGRWVSAGVSVIHLCVCVCVTQRCRGSARVLVCYTVVTLVLHQCYTTKSSVSHSHADLEDG